MSGGFLPYHLRPCKAIDRKIFLDFIRLAATNSSLEDYTYVGFGGPFLEDFKQIHAETSITNMICIEEDGIVHQRQKNNLPFGCIELLNQTSLDFITNYTIEGNTATWLDYASPQIDVQFKECFSLLTKLKEEDIFKVTFNSNIDTLGKPKDYTPRNGASVLKEHRLSVAKSKLSDYFPNSHDHTSMTAGSYAKFLADAFQILSQKAMKGNNLELVITSVCKYADTHQMFTISGIVLDSDKKERYLEETRINNWEFLYHNHGIINIKVPVLSLREKLTIDSYLPNGNAQQIQQAIGHQFDTDPQTSIQMINSYIKFYKHYPHFSRIMA